MRRTLISIFAAFAITGCGNGQSAFAPITSAEAAVPAFLQIGKTYAFLGIGKLTILEIDKSSGWVKVTLQGNTIWINLATIATIGIIQ